VLDKSNKDQFAVYGVRCIEIHKVNRLQGVYYHLCAGKTAPKTFCISMMLNSIY